MKKNRNAFFQESNYQSYNPNMNGIGIPYQSASNYYYQGPVPQNNYNIADNGMDIESRLAKFKDYVKDCMEKSGFKKNASFIRCWWCSSPPMGYKEQFEKSFDSVWK